METILAKPAPAAIPARGAAAPFYRPELDVLRFFAFLLVFSGHAMRTDPQRYARLMHSRLAGELVAGFVKAGPYGVDLFFCLSSYLITTLLVREHQARGSIDVQAFYVRRILRIWPLYFVALLGIGPLVGLLLPAERLPWQYLASFLLLSGNWATAAWGFPHSATSILWSVSIEEQFYLAWPLVMRRWLGRLPAIAWALIAAAIVCRALLVWSGAPRDAIFCNTIARLDPIAAGALIGFALKGRAPRFKPAVRGALAGAGLATLAVCGAAGAGSGAASLWTYPAVTLASVSLLLAAIGARLDWMPAPLSGALVYLGRISYGLYVFHGLCLAVLLAFAARLGAAQAPFALALTIGCAALSYRFLERPFLRIKQRFGPAPE